MGYGVRNHGVWSMKSWGMEYEIMGYGVRNHGGMEYEITGNGV